MNTKYYHGGVPGLKAGELVRPPQETGVASTATAGFASNRRHATTACTSPPTCRLR